MTFPRVMLFIAAMVVAVALGLTINALFLDQSRPKSTTIGVAAIGGPFELVDHQGRKVRDSDYRGSYLLVMFGYTFCPDVCPTELQLITEAMELLGPEASKVQPLLITVDPERDTAEILADYVGNFHPAIIGLTGSVEQVKSAARAYKVFFAKGEADSEGDYFMDHSSFIYLMSPDGAYLHHFAPNMPAEAMAERIRAEISEN
ncbi:MAG: redoxin domain-containing protein [Rhodospirillaceae bacterium]|jgi:cytochrome oxidase Cu insertion factor (SCO1/SenC/PrrC family)|nr:redoxin domain-containing protein [Rhodospirillaceae bacterium]MBT4488759.1 redoxin domain-containing protein [Rhodospirillaceae bacterium]MBT5193866.1 redoxin domain-containing protein [Rhodospirillaceae bacterium]MBT5897078.1 redoxin domain-containing protein [Rhodospirillaceae bacterium]MBT6427339.1 redoxin domain-containing protein [Rhodospirillaceae bacterium]